MGKSITVTPAYGRDYKSKALAIADWKAGKDFRLETIDGRPYGTYCSIRDFKPGTEVRIRYNFKRNVVSFIIKEEKENG